MKELCLVIMGFVFGMIAVIAVNESKDKQQRLYNNAYKEGRESLQPTQTDIIRTAAERNGITYKSDDWYILRGINKAEGNVKGCEYGIMNPEANNLDSQAGWCAASIVKGRQRWIDAGKPEDFITFMGRRYCPPADHPLNVNWVPNVTYWANELERIDNE